MVCYTLQTAWLYHTYVPYEKSFSIQLMMWLAISEPIKHTQHFVNRFIGQTCVMTLWKHTSPLV